MFRQIYSKYASKCGRCGARIDSGALCGYDKALPRGRRARCMPCLNSGDAAPAPPAGARHEVAAYDTLADLRASVATVTPGCNAGIFERSVTRHAEGSLSWFGVDGGFAAVERLHREGWPEGVERMLAAMGQLSLSSAPTSVLRRPVRGDHGDELDIHRVNSGDFAHAWTRRTRRHVRAPRTVTLIADWNMHCGEEADRLFWRGAALLRLADLLGEAGYQVEIVAYDRSINPYATGSGTRAVYATVKEIDAPVDVNALAAAICLAGTFRSYGFAALLNSAHDLNSGLGQPDKKTPPAPPQSAGDMILHARAESVYDEASAVVWLTQAIEQVEAA